MIEMKDSGIEWIGEIPAHWAVKRLKDVSILNPSYNGCDLEGDVSFVPMESLRCGQIDLQEISFSEAKGKYTFFAEEDLLVAKVTPCFENGNIALAKNLKQGIGFGSSEIFVLRCIGVLNKYLFYYSFSNEFQGRACSTMCGVGGLKRISPLFMRTHQLAIPPLAEQQTIADYLDKKTAEIDEQITALEKKSDAYQRLKRSLISEVVTRGLNPTAELKDSGIEWIGEIPAHWVVKRLKDIADLGSGTTPKSSNEKYYDGTHPWLITGDVQNRLIERNENFITDLALADIPNLKLYPAKTVLLAMYGGGTIGNVGLMTYPAYINQACCAMIPKSGIYEKYLFYYLRTKYSRIISTGVGGTQINLSQNKIAAYPIAVPPFKEQQTIADYLDKKTAEIDGNISAISSKIDAYKRLKQSLIDEVVTGKRRIERA